MPYTKKQKEIMPIYKSLEGLLRQVFSMDSSSEEPGIEDFYNKQIERLKELNPDSKDIWDNFRVEAKSHVISHSPQREPVMGNPVIDINEYKGKLSSLIGEVHGRFFIGEPSPDYGNSPRIMNVQNQQQSQEQIQIQVQTQMLLDVQEKIVKKQKEYKKGSRERKFIDKLKEKLSSVKGYIEFITLVYEVAKAVGLSPDKALKILSN